MKLVRSITLLALVFEVTMQLSAQPKPISSYITPSGKDIVNTRIDNMSYWKKMIKLGFVTTDPVKPIPSPLIRSSQILGDGLFIQDSPDVPVTAEENATQSENSVFADPDNEDVILNSNNSTDWTNSTAVALYGADGLWSLNAGLNWGGSVYGAGGSNGGDPTTAIGLNGWYYVGMINSENGQSVSYSTNQGATWNEVVCSPGAGGGNMLDKNHLWIDNKLGSPYQGYLYDAWTNFVEGSPNITKIELVRSINQGLTWGSPVNISAGVNAGSHDQGVNLQTGPNGEVYAVWAVYDSWPSDETAIGFSKSINGGAVFTPATRIINNIRGIRTTGTTKDMRVNSFPSMAVDVSGGVNNGTIYVVWSNIGYPGVNTGSDIDVYMIRSSDQGTTWSAPLRVNQGPVGAGKQHYMPWITCDPDNGNLAIVYYDDRNVSATQCEAWVSYSYDGGVSWEDVRVSDVAFTPMPISGLATGYMGDYLGITAKNMKVYPIWTDNRSGRAMAYVSPLVMGPQPNQAYIVYQSVDVATIGGIPGQSLNYGDSLHLTLGLKNIGDQPTSTITAYLSSESPFVTITDSSEFYNHFSVGEIKVIPLGYTVKVSDSVPDGLMVRFNVRATNGDSSWFSHFYLELHAPALAITQLVIKDSISGNNNHRLDPGEVVTAYITTINPGDFDCMNSYGKLSSNSDFLILQSDSVYLGTIASGQSAVGSFTISVSDESPVGTSTYLTYKVKSGNYSTQKSFQETIGIVDEDWETHSFNKFPWTFGGTMGWVLTDVNPYEGVWSARSGVIYDQQTSQLKLTYTGAVDDTISFYRKTSSEPSYDFLNFYIDNVIQDGWSGENQWERVAYPVSAGTHLYKWEYTKDIFLSIGSDCGWIDFIEFPPPVLPTITAGPADTICAGATYHLQGEAQNYDSLAWTTSGDGTFNFSHAPKPIYTPGTNDVANGVVTLTLTGYGISGNSISHMTLTISAIPTAVISGQKEICSGDSTSIMLTLTGTPPWTIILTPYDSVITSNAVYSYMVSPTAQTSYTIAKVYGLHGCVGSSSGTATVQINPLPSVSISASPNDTLCTWQTLILAANAVGASTYVWQPGEKTGAEVSYDMASLGGVGLYWFKLQATSNKSCVTHDSVRVFVKECVGIEDEVKGFESVLYPNPNKGKFTLYLYAPTSEKVDLVVVNELNQVIFKEDDWLVSGKMQRKFDLKKVEAGVYYLKIQRNSGEVVHKVVVDTSK